MKRVVANPRAGIIVYFALLAGLCACGDDGEGTAASPAPALLVRTGQTTCYDTAGSRIDCAGTGQDGAVQAGIRRRHVDNRDGTISDLSTGLMWEKKSADGSIHDLGNQYSWGDAFTVFVAGLNSDDFAGHNDWRLPNISELQTLQDYGAFNPAVDLAFNTGCASGCSVTGCSCTQTERVWSSTTRTGVPFYAWTIWPRSGQVESLGKSEPSYVRAVRGSGSLQTGQADCYDKFNKISCAGTGQDGAFQAGVRREYVDNGDGTITDISTGLMWEKKSADGSLHDLGNQYSWGDAFTVFIAEVNRARFAGYSDWRLPNVNELQTLQDYGAFNPAVDAAFNTGCAPGCTVTTCSCTETNGYWSSTTYVSPAVPTVGPSNAWCVYFDFCLIDLPEKSDTFYARAVRGGL